MPGSIAIVCAARGKEFSDYPCKVRGGRRFCSKPCAGQRPRLHGSAFRDQETAEFRIWCLIRRRCLNPDDRSYHNYGGRGIAICAAWKDSFAVFLADVGSRPSPDHEIDRSNNDGNYEPGNVRWATRVQQANNRRKNARLTGNGRSQTLPEWARELGISDKTLRNRLITAGWPVEAAMTEPIHKATDPRPRRNR